MKIDIVLHKFHKFSVVTKKSVFCLSLKQYKYFKKNVYLYKLY